MNGVTSRNRKSYAKSHPNGRSWLTALQPYRGSSDAPLTVVLLAGMVLAAFPGTDTSDFLGSVRCSATGGDLFTAVALEMDSGTRIFTTLPVAPVPERMSQE